VANLALTFTEAWVAESEVVGAARPAEGAAEEAPASLIRPAAEEVAAVAAEAARAAEAAPRAEAAGERSGPVPSARGSVRALRVAYSTGLGWLRESPWHAA